MSVELLFSEVKEEADKRQADLFQLVFNLLASIHQTNKSICEHQRLKLAYLSYKKGLLRVAQRLRNRGFGTLTRVAYSDFFSAQAFELKNYRSNYRKEVSCGCCWACLIPNKDLWAGVRPKEFEMLRQRRSHEPGCDVTVRSVDTGTSDNPSACNPTAYLFDSTA